ncbi:Predicted Peptidoglycan domain-containing protein [Sphingobium sp. AP50]|uniref:glycoside hydrolase family 108 protein n=1 Tax=Sphingobium sp. AP50 TaxID=1884369 RepID=UPI0008CE5DA4|nr:glycosyl hydrolase 108 family protein [Sphingobium sp. AP50]SEI67850.1 Predicted Peptidoglycan domain-containing protein [Sphingobium sp. AP50]
MSKGKILATASAAALAIVASVFNVEGGYVNNPADPGGATNHGVTQAVARADGFTGDMRDFPKEWAQKIVYEGYIVKPGFLPLVDLSPAAAEELIDSGVNAGPTKPSIWLQTALNSLNRQGKDWPELTVDGQVGAKTIAAYASLQKLRGRAEACRMIVKLLDAQQAAHYLNLAKNNSNFETFMPGWTINRLGNVPLEKCA